MSRMMDNLARVLEESGEDAQRPNLQLIRSGIVPSPEAAAENRASSPIRKLSKIKVSVLALALITATAATTALWQRSSGRVAEISAAPANGEGIELIKSENYTAAEASLRQQLITQPGQKLARINHAFSLKALGRFSEAEKEYLETLRQHGRDPLTLNNLGVLYSVQKKTLPAINLFRESLNKDPTYSDARLNLAYALEHAGRMDQALVQYLQYLETAEGSPQNLEALKERSRKLHSISAGQKPAEEKF